MSDTIASDATPHPRQGTPRRAARVNSRNEDHSDSEDDQDLLHPSATTTHASTSASNSRPQSRGTNRKTTWNEKDQADSDSEESSLDSFDDEDENENENGARRRSRRRRRLSSSASHILAQAPAVPDLRFDHNYRKALDQCYESFAADYAKAAARAAALSSSASENPDSKSSTQQGQRHPISVPSVAARITVMTLRDIIIMPFVHGFFWGFGTVLLTLASQRSLSYHIHRTWSNLFGSSGGDEKPMTIRGEPARVRRFGGSNLSGLGLMNAGSAAPAPAPASGLGRPIY